MFPTLLCVDDRPSGLELRRSTLKAHGYPVLTAITLHAALQILHREPIAAVLVEYKGEGMDPEAVAFRVKQQFPNMPVVLLSAYSELPGRLLWLVDDYVMKGEPVEALLGILGRFVRASPDGKVETKVATEDKRRDAAA
jgi:CheY-like chemotaxis protein